ncbi:MAG: hypothetical protein GY804_02590 [Alphaproteobacteria bacterium]|nr:hypothetical protein [Alphaproteobacteria bacterium]
MAKEKKMTIKEKHPGGRPHSYETEEKLSNKIDEYFKQCEPQLILTDNEDGTKTAATDRHGNPVFNENPPTVAGIAHFLGYASRQSLYDLKNCDKFSYIIKKALLFIESYHEKKLSMGQCVGSIFWLKNHNWRDKQELEHSGGVTTTIDYSKLTDEELKKIVESSN